MSSDDDYTHDGDDARPRDEQQADRRPRLVLGRPPGVGPMTPERARELAERMAELLLDRRPDGGGGEAPRPETEGD